MPYYRLYSTKFFPFRIPYLSMIIVDPLLAYSGYTDESGMIISERRLLGAQNHWLSKEAVLDFFSSNALSKTWDARALSIYVVCAPRKRIVILLIHLSSNLKKHGTYTEQLAPMGARIMPKCDSESENDCFLDIESTLDAMDQIAKVCQNVPIHAIFGELSDVV